jgi:hypothetical protein
MHIKNWKRKTVLDAGGLFLIGTCCVLYSIFRERFAEVHIQFSFLSFPIFIGEQLLAICGVLALVKIWIDKKNNKLIMTRYHWILIAYLAWLFAKAINGYFQYSPEAYGLRNSALFYYPLFAIVCYSFYNKKFINKRIILILAVLFFVLLTLKLSKIYYWWPTLLLCLVVGYKLENKFIQICLMLFIVYLLSNYFVLFFRGSRSHVIGMLGSVIFLAGYMLSIYDRIKIWQKLVCGGSIVLLFILGITFLMDKTSVRSMFSPIELYKTFVWHEEYINNKKKTFEKRDIPPQLFTSSDGSFKEVLGYYSRNLVVPRDNSNNTKTPPFKGNSENLPSNALMHRADVDIPAGMINKSENHVDPAGYQEIMPYLNKGERDILLNPDAPPERKITLLNQDPKRFHRTSLDNLMNMQFGRSLETANLNVLFRVFIWRDMFEELWTKRAFWGLSFGHPQRSISIEIMGWARAEWERDGWITPHNSFIHIIYRAGIVGLILIIGFFWCCFKMVKHAILHKSIIAGLLFSALVYWFVLANFLVFLEFPYSAIPFWSLFGLTYAYVQSLGAAQNNANTNYS